MNRKIFYAIWSVTTFVLVAAVAVIIAVFYSSYQADQMEHLKIETELATTGVTQNGADYLKEISVSEFRITWIRQDGTVLYDNEFSNDEMENHLEREEVRDAIEKGYGQSSRYSDTLAEKSFYAAEKLPDGSILRLCVTQTSLWKLMSRFMTMMIIIVAAGLVFSLILARRLSARITEPINRMSLEDPMQYESNESYAEIRPLLHRLDEQNRQIQHDKAELEKTSLIRQEFTANASHELKTPLHVISGYAELIENGMVKEQDIPVFAGKIRRESQRMTNLVEDIIELSHLDSAAYEEEFEPCDLRRIADNTADSLKQTADEAGVQITVSGPSAVVDGIPSVIHSIIYNLTSNAVKYSFSGGNVEITTEDLSEQAAVHIRDEGVGIAEEEQSRIFERFYRVDKSRSKEVGGTGLGLSIVKHAALLHNASVKVDSKIGKGSVFTVIFPKKQS